MSKLVSMIEAAATGARHGEDHLSWLLGEARVNVLELNRDVDGLR